MTPILISRTDIDWTSFVTTANTLLSQSVTRKLDSSNITVGGYESYLMALGQIEYPNISPFIFMSSELSNRALEHLWFSFLIEMPYASFCEAIKISDLKFMSTSKEGYEVGVISGNLRQWRDAIVFGMSKDQPRDLRTELLEFWKIFLNLGLRSIFTEYSLKSMSDKTLYLEH